jgi:hypothetical protein
VHHEAGDPRHHLPDLNLDVSLGDMRQLLMEFNNQAKYCGAAMCVNAGLFRGSTKRWRRLKRFV